MSIIYNIILWLNSYVDKPKFYGLYHFSWLLGIVALCTIYVFISKSKRDNKEKIFKTTILICWILLVIFELIKELSMSISFDLDGKATFKYNFLYFPYQLCSLPFYVLPFILFTKNEKIKQFFIGPTITYIFLGGFLFLLIPGSLCNNLYLNFHTFAHHGLQVFTSVVCFLWYKETMSTKNFIKVIPTLVISMGLSIILNIVLYKVTGYDVQLWNLSPYVVMDLDFLENIRQNLGYVIYFLLYFTTLLALSFIIYTIPLLIKRLKEKQIK